MKKRISLVILAFAACACGGASSSFGTYDDYMQVVARNLREAHATFDGQRVLDAKPHGTCEASIITLKGLALVRWKDFGNLAPHLQGKMTLYDLYSPEGKHTFVAPTRPEDMNPVAVNFGLLDSKCWDKAQHTRNFKWGG